MSVIGDIESKVRAVVDDVLGVTSAKLEDAVARLEELDARVKELEAQVSPPPAAKAPRGKNVTATAQTAEASGTATL